MYRSASGESKCFVWFFWNGSLKALIIAGYLSDSKSDLLYRKIKLGSRSS